ncbi:MAG TPA: transglutaminaseTgpA domain-containing protein [Actinomycetota bacterium]
MASSKRLLPFALAAVMALSSVACDGGDKASGAIPNDAAPAESDPFISVRAQLGEQAVRDLFEVEAAHAEYWRMFTLDRFDGESWTSTNPDGSKRGVALLPPVILPQSGGRLPPGAETLNQTFRILSDFDITHALPMAQTAEEIAGPIGNITWDPVRAQAFIDRGLEEGMEYAVRSRIVIPTPEQLDQVEFFAPQAYGEWTELPADLDPQIGLIAKRWTAAATSDYRKVLAIQQHFHNGLFVYSTDVEPAEDGDALLEFLTQTRTGFCQHYTAAMTVMVRALGLPARIAVGYRSGTRQEDGSYLVQSDDVHVWVEVLFPGYGWLQFEPEAGTTHPNAQAGTYLNPITAMDAS